MRPAPKRVAALVCFFLGGRASDVLCSFRRRKEDAHRRALTILLWWTLNGRPTYTETGRVFDRDRTTVRRALEHANAWVQSGETRHALYSRIVEKLSA